MLNTLSDELAAQLGISELDASQRMRLLSAFDAEFYIEQNPEVGLRAIDAFVHFMTQGWRECRDPSAGFRTLDYLLEHRDALRGGANPLVAAVLGNRVVASGNTTPFANAASQSPRPMRDEMTSTGTISHLSNQEPPDFDWSSIPAASERPTGCENLSADEIDRIRNAFDADYYLQHNFDVAHASVDPFQHYMSIGWHESRDPSPNFSTGFYLSYYPDIKASGMNPFVHWILHGVNENRTGISFRQRLDLKLYSPMISAIVPNFNHGRYLAERIESILNQTYPHISITILDDCSTDNSREIIDSYVERYPSLIRAIYNEQNSGGVFRQWKKGVEETDGDLIWICESDDFCEPDFIEKLVPFFRDDSVQIAFGRVLETDINGRSNEELDSYRELAEPGIWTSPLVRPAAAWFAGAFGVRNVIANVGGCIWRRAPIPESVWQEAATYKVVGDWHLYVQIASGGQIAWEPTAISYFRRHGTNTSSSSFAGPKFYAELERFMLHLRKSWEIPTETVRLFYQKIEEQYAWFEVEREHGPLEGHCNLKRLLTTQRTKPHVLIAMYGFIPGGGENFPIFLANGLVDSGWTVSMLVFETREVNMHMRRALNPAVSVYDSSWIAEYGAERFLREAGISLIHSHTVGAELHFFYMWRVKADVRFLVTLHGSYEASDLPRDAMEALTAPVDHFVYTADKNLLPLAKLGIPANRFTKLANAMPIDLEPFPQTRAEMGIAQDSIVFTLVARGIKRKGWRAAVQAFIRLRKAHPDQPMHLCLVGDGEMPELLKKKHGKDPTISFLGYQSRINGLYRMTDVAIVPTRFSGESYPLCIIQALQVGTPVIGSDVGEIRSMLTRPDGVEAGLVIDAVRDTEKFTMALFNAMEKMLDKNARNLFARGAKQLGRDYDMEKLVETYGQIYENLISIGSEPMENGESTRWREDRPRLRRLANRG